MTPEYHDSVMLSNKTKEISLIVQIQDNRPQGRLSTEAIQRAPRPLKSVDDVEGRDSFPLSVFCVGDRITNNLRNIREGYDAENKLLTFSRKILRTPRVSS